MPADALLPPAAMRGLRTRAQLLTWTLIAVLLARALSAVLLTALSPLQGADGSFWDLYADTLDNWDGAFYQRIATDGYPPLSATSSAADAQTWLFLPLYPAVVAGVMAVTGTPFAMAATGTSLVFAALGSVALTMLLAPKIGAPRAIGAVVLLSVYVTSPLLQVGYSEGLALFFLVSIFLLLDRGRVALAIVPLVLLALTRSITPPLALVGLWLLWTDVRSVRSRSRSRVRAIALGTFSVVAVSAIWLWPLMAMALGADPAKVNRPAISAHGGFGWFGDTYSMAGWIGPVFVGLLLILLIVLMNDSRWDDWGMPLRLWGWAYPLFLFSVTTVHAGILRYLMLAFPLGMAVVGVQGRRFGWVVRTVVIAVGLLVAQWLWLRHVYILDPDDPWGIWMA